MLVYLNSSWPLECGAETLFLDTASDTGVAVRPRPGRVVLMDQDVMHRVNAASPTAPRPRYSLVWKLALTSRVEGQTPSILMNEHRRTVPFGSAMSMRVAQDSLG